MTQKFSAEQIRQFWIDSVLKHRQSPSASWSDKRAIEMEIREIGKHLQDGDRVLDIGCGNGYSTVQFALSKRIHIHGIDYIPEMIKEAQVRLGCFASSLLGTAKFDVGDIRNLREPTGTYNKVIVIRVIINLGEWSCQLQGLRESARVLKKGGVLLLSEATLQGWQKLNRFRREWGLPEISMPPFNQYLDEEQVIEALSSDLKLIELSNFSSTYYIGTRILKPLVIQALGAKINVANPDMDWNRWFSQLPAWGDYGIQKLFVFEKT